MTTLSKRGDDEIQKLRMFVRETKDSHERDRARAIIKLIEGRKRKDIADIFDVNIKTVDEWIKKYKRMGIKGLRTKPQKGNNRILTVRQKQEIKETITHKRPDEVGLLGRFWNVPNLKAYIKGKYKIVYRSPVSYTRLFAYCGFTYHKPNKVNEKQSPHMRKRFEETLKKSSNGIEEKIAWYW
jgi:transposase